MPRDAQQTALPDRRPPGPGSPARGSVPRHIVQLYQDEAALCRTTGEYLREGLAAGEAVLVFATAPHLEAFARHLREAGIDLAGALEAGRLRLLDSGETLERFLVDGHPDARRFRPLAGEQLRRARAAAPSGRVRVFGEMVHLLWEQGMAQATLELERLWEEVVDAEGCTLMCAYPVRDFDREIEGLGFAGICGVHAELCTAGELEPPSGANRDGLLRFLQRQAARLREEVAERRRAEERLALLAEASILLSSSLEYEVTLQNMLRLTIPLLGDFGFVDIVESEEDVRRMALAHERPDIQAILDQSRWVRSERRDINLCALSSGEAGFHPDIGDAWLRNAAASPEHLEVMRRLGFCSMITVPIEYQGRILGAFTLFYAWSRRQHTPAEVALAGELACRAAAALQNARLYREVREAMRRQEEADRRKDEFIALLGHELRNPLAPILSAIELLKWRDGEAAHKARGVIERQTRHLVRLVDDLLEISRITRGRIELRREPMELSTAVSRAIELAGPAIEKRDPRLEVEVPSEGLPLLADPLRLAQIIANLLTNAARYTHPGGVITLRGGRENGEVRLEVHDTGVGIPAESIASIFEPFVQVARPGTAMQSGLGLGLTLVKGLAQLHGGRVEARSAGLGCGSTFTLALPALASTGKTDGEGEAGEGAEGAASSAVDDEAGGPRRWRILVVDDNQDAAELLTDVLRELGHEVALAHNGVQALALAPDFVPDLALLDIGMPGMNGYELARKLREVPALREVRLFALTGYGQQADRVRSQEAGFQRHFVKPIELEVLEKAIETLT